MPLTLPSTSRTLMLAVPVPFQPGSSVAMFISRDHVSTSVSPTLELARRAADAVLGLHVVAADR